MKSKKRAGFRMNTLEMGWASNIPSLDGLHESLLVCFTFLYELFMETVAGFKALC